MPVDLTGTAFPYQSQFSGKDLLRHFSRHIRQPEIPARVSIREQLVADGGAYGLKHGQHIAHDPEKHRPLADALFTVAQKMGAETEAFPDATSEFTDLT